MDSKEYGPMMPPVQKLKQKWHIVDTFVSHVDSLNLKCGHFGDCHDHQGENILFRLG